MNKSLKLLIAQSSPINSEKITALKTEYNKTRNLHRKLTREDKAKQSVGRDKLLFSDPDPAPAPFRTLQLTSGPSNYLQDPSTTLQGPSATI